MRSGHAIKYVCAALVCGSLHSISDDNKKMSASEVVSAAATSLGNAAAAELPQVAAVVNAVLPQAAAAAVAPVVAPVGSTEGVSDELSPHSLTTKAAQIGICGMSIALQFVTVLIAVIDIASGAFYKDDPILAWTCYIVIHIVLSAVCLFLVVAGFVRSTDKATAARIAGVLIALVAALVLYSVACAILLSYRERYEGEHPYNTNLSTDATNPRDRLSMWRQFQTFILLSSLYLTHVFMEKLNTIIGAGAS